MQVIYVLDPLGKTGILMKTCIFHGPMALLISLLHLGIPGVICPRVKSFSNNLTVVLGKKVVSGYFLLCEVFSTSQPSLLPQGDKGICNFCFHGFTAPFSSLKEILSN